MYQILTDTFLFFFFSPILQRGGKLRVDVLRVFPGEEWALHKEMAGGVKSPNTRNEDEFQLIKRIKLEVYVNQLTKEMIRLMIRRNLSLESAEEIEQMFL